MSGTLHGRIRGDFEARILSGALAPGDRLPTEQALMVHYGCARMTVHKALSSLAAAGLIERRRKAGTFVARPRAHSAVLAIPDLAAEIEERGQRYGWRLLGRTLRAHDPATDGTMLELDGVHEADGRPLAAEHRLVAVAMAGGIEAADLATQSPGAWLLAHVPWSEAETRITAAAASAHEAATLHVDEGAPLLCVTRRTWRGGRLVTMVRQTFVADAYELVARFGPQASPQNPSGSAIGPTTSP